MMKYAVQVIAYTTATLLTIATVMDAFPSDFTKTMSVTARITEW